MKVFHCSNPFFVPSGTNGNKGIPSHFRPTFRRGLNSPGDKFGGQNREKERGSKFGKGERWRDCVHSAATTVIHNEKAQIVAIV